MIRKNLAKIVYWTLLAAAFCGLASQLFTSIASFFSHQAAAINYPYSIDYGEGPLLDQTMRMADFENIYRSSIAASPYTISNYPPVYLLVQVPFAWIFGPSYWYGRLINLLSVLLTALFIALTLKALTRGWTGPVVAGLLLLAFPYIHHWSMFNRIDELALMLSWAALYVSVRHLGFSRQGGPRGVFSAPDLKSAVRPMAASPALWGAAVLFTAAIFTRQTYALAAPFAAFFWLIFGTQGKWKLRVLQAVLLGLGVGGLAILMFLILNITSAGGFYLNIVVANVNAFFWNTVEHYAGQIGSRYWPLLALSLIFLTLELIRVFKRRAPEPEQPDQARLSSWALVLPYLLASAAGSITIGKDGSNVNYLLELSAALSLGGGAMLEGVMSAWQPRRLWLRGLVQLAVVVLLAYQAGVMVKWDSRDNATYIQDRQTHLQAVEETLQLLKNTPGPVLTDEYMGLVPLAGKRLYFQPFEFKQLAQAKVWDEQPLLNEIAEHKFDYILWYKPPGWPGSIEARWTPAQRQVVQLYYQLDRKLGDIYVYVPKK